MIRSLAYGYRIVAVAILSVVALAIAALPAWSAPEPKLFYTSSAQPGMILRVAEDGTALDPLPRPASDAKYAVHASGIYWLAGNLYDRIGHMNLDGTGVDPDWLTGVTGAGFRTTIAAGNGHVCWADHQLLGDLDGHTKISCVAVGSDGKPGPITVVYESAHLSGSSLAVDDDYVYFDVIPKWAGADQIVAIGRARLDGTESTETLITGLRTVNGLAVNDRTLFYTVHEPQSYTPPIPALYSASKDGLAGSTPLVANPQGKSLNNVSADNNHVWWADGRPAADIARSTVLGAEVDRAVLKPTGGATVELIGVVGPGGCRSQLDFQTSMIATGCFHRLDESKWRAEGAFRFNGIDAVSPDDTAYPVIFDTKNKTIDGDRVTVSLSAAGWGSGWLLTDLTNLTKGLHLSFPTAATSWTMPLYPSLPPGGVGIPSLLRSVGFLRSVGGLGNTLFGYPAHQPYVDMTMTSGATQLTAKISFPTRSDAFIDPINGLWKAPDGKGGARINYPTSLQVVVHAGNAEGVDRIEGVGQPANIYGIDPSKGKKGLIVGKAGPPAPGVIELAKLKLGWQMAKGIIDLGAVLVLHIQPWDKAAKMLPKEFFLGRPIAEVDVGLTWWKLPGTFNAFLPDEKVPAEPMELAAPLPTELKMSVNALNRPAGATGLFWQRLGLAGGYDLSKNDQPFHLGASAGFSFLPRFKHDFFWFQEALTLDVSGDIAFSPTTLTGVADLKTLDKLNLLHGGFSYGPDGMILEGTTRLPLPQMWLFTGGRASLVFEGKSAILWPAGGKWQWQGTGTMTLQGAKNSLLIGKADMAWTEDGFGLCYTAGRFKGQALVFDGKWRWVGCDSGPFVRAAAARVLLKAPKSIGGRGGAATAAAARPLSFTVPRGVRVRAVAIRGGKAGAPRVTVTGPGGLKLSVDRENPIALGRAAALVVNEGKRSDQTTTLMLSGNAKPGTYRIVPAKGSPAIKGLAFAQAAPPVRVKARAAAAAKCRRQLSWNLRPLAGQRVTFLERTGKGPGRPLLTTAKAKGKRTFTPADSTTAKRTIVARVQQQGAVRKTITVARYRYGGATPGQVAKPATKRKGKNKNVTVSWKPVCGAALYQVTTGSGEKAVTRETTKTQLTLGLTKGTQIVIRAVGPTGTTGKASKTIKTR